MRGKFLAHFLFRLKWVSTSSKDAGKSAQWGDLLCTCVYFDSKISP